LAPYRRFADALADRRRLQNVAVMGSESSRRIAEYGAADGVIEDPDGNAVGIMSPIDHDRRSQPDCGET
jgi:hypothetical protein